MRKFYISAPLNFRLIRLANFKVNQIILFFTFLFLLITPSSLFSQGVLPTKGKDFWIGFPYFPAAISITPSSRRCDVFITSDVTTTGTISIPVQAWSQTFTVLANQTTTITLPIPMVEHTTTEVVENKGVEVVTQDTVSVFALSFQDYSADATVVYPIQSLGTEYRISSYQGLSYSSFPKLNSNFIIVAGESGTQINITPTAPTMGGHPAGVPFTINLNAGESYQVLASQYSDDFTGTQIKGSDSSGSCRPFAVFSGTVCAHVPNGCYACDILYDQASPVSTWGKTYYVVPFSFATTYTYRILADQNNTFYSINGGPLSILNAGQFVEFNSVTTANCISAAKPISVIQYMEGVTCAGAGDPSMMYLNSDEQKIDRVTFSTITSSVINQHDVNVIINTSDIGQLKLDGVNVPASSFTVMPNCNTISYAQLPLTQGSHTLAADSGFTAYVYGTGNAESYAYSVGSYSKSKQIIVDSVLCTTDTIHIGVSNSMYGTWWSTKTNPTDTIGTGPVLMLTPPIIPDIYIEHGNENISGCLKDFYFNVEIPNPPLVQISTAADTVCQNQHVQLNATTIPVSSIYQYTWTPATGLSNPSIANPIATITQSSWYKVAISSPDGCANTVYDSIYLFVLPLTLPVTSAGADQSICLGSSATLSATGGISYSWSQGGNTSSIIVSPVINTNYIVYTSDSNGCVNSDTVLVGVRPLPNASAGSDQTICDGTTTSLTASGGIAYLWTPGGSTNAINIINPHLTANYVVQVTGANGCTKNDTAIVTVNPLPNANAGADQSICMGSSATLSASGGNSYLWSPGGNTTSSITVTPLINTNYIVKVTDQNGCQNRDSVYISVHPKPTANAGPNLSICTGSPVSINASGGVYYSWTPGGYTTSTINVTPTINTNYIVIVSDSIGCQGTDTVLVTVHQLPTVNAGVDKAICLGDSTLLSTTSVASSYLWTPSGSTNSSTFITPVNTTNYILEITDNNGCINKDTVLITVYPAAVAYAGVDDTICFGYHINLTATGGLSYFWSPGGNTTSTINVSPPINTNYIVLVTDSNGCINRDTVLVYVKPSVTGSSSVQSICTGSATTLVVSGGISYLWSPGGATSDSITVSPTIMNSYVVTISESNGCLVKDTFNININNLPPAYAGADQAICIGTNTLLNASGGNAYFWTTTGTTGQAITVAPTVNTNYVVEVTDINGCKNKDTVLVVVNPLPNANAGTDQSICIGSSTSLTASGGISYLWSPGGNTSSTIVVSPVIATNYIVQVTDTNGCINNDTATITMNPLMVTDFNLSHPVCEKSTLTFSNASSVAAGSIANNYWNFGDGSASTGISPTHTFSNAGNYSVQLIIKSNYGCIDSISHLITVNTNPDVNFSTGNNCVGQLIQFKDLSTITTGTISKWFWDFGDGSNSNLQNPTHPYAQAGKYTIQLNSTSDSGCVISRVKNSDVEIYPLPIPEFTTSPSTVSFLNPLVQFIDQSSGGLNWRWDFGDNKGISDLKNPSYMYGDTGIFNIQMILTGNHGCIDTVMGEVYIEPYFTIYIPNAFTPNDDGVNDYFSPKGIGFENYNMFIYDRWGKILFHSDNLSVPWDGQLQNSSKSCSQGEYIYLISMTDYLNIKHEFTGRINLIR